MKKLLFVAAVLLLVMSVPAMSTDLVKFDMNKANCDWAVQNSLGVNVRNLVVHPGWSFAMSTDNPFNSAGNTSVRCPGNSFQCIVLNNDTDPLSLNPSGSNQLTIQAWVKLASLSTVNHNHVTVLRWPNGDHMILRIDMSGKPSLWGTFGNGGVSWGGVVAPNAMPLNQWVHLAGASDSGTLRLYVNGVEVASEHVSDTPISTSNLKNFSWDGSVAGCTFGDYFDGWIDDVMISDTVIAPAQLGYHAPFTPYIEALPNKAIALYNLDCALGSQNKRVVNSLNPSNYMTPALGGLHGWEGNTPGAALVLEADDPFNSPDSRSVRFFNDDTKTRYIQVYPPADMDLSNGDRRQFTIEGWIKPAVLGGHMLTIYGGGGYVALALNSNGTVLFRGYEGEFVPNVFDATSASPVPLDAWSHIAGVCDGATLKVYINAELQGTCPVAAFNAPVTGTVAIGDYFTGLIDDVRVTQGVLAPSEFGYHGCLSDVETLETASVATFNMDALLDGNTVTPDVSGTGCNVRWWGALPTASSDDPFGAADNNSIKLDPSVGQTYGEAITTSDRLDLFNNGRNQFTIEAWIKPAALDYSTIAQFSYVDSVNNYHTVRFGLWWDGRIDLSTLIYEWKGVRSPEPLPYDVWSHVACIYNGDGYGKFKLYINGEEVASANAGEIMPAYPTGLILGGAGGLGYTWGLLDDIRLSKMALPVSELGYFKSFSSSVDTPVFTPAGGNFALPQSVTITCATPGASVYYTTDGTAPDKTKTLYNGTPIAVSETTTIQARAYVGSQMSDIAIATFNFPTTLNRPAKVPYAGSTITVDGNLTEWPAEGSPEWAPLDQTVDIVPSDIEEAYYAAKWTENKVYMAVKVKDTAHFLTNSYVSYDARDAVELYLHTTGQGSASYFTTQAPAQQYAVGIKPAGGVWSIVGNEKPVLPGFQAAGVVSGQWLYYEAAMTPFEFYGGLLDPVQPNIASPLSSGQIIGLDVLALGHNGITYTGSKSENTMAGKYNDYTKFGLHLLVDDSGTADAKTAPDGTIVDFSGIVSADFGDFFYVEKSDRTYGICVDMPGHGLTVGQVVDGTGRVDTLDSGERYIVGLNAAVTGTDRIDPLGMTNKALGGSDYGTLPNGQCGVTNGTGLNNIGILVKTTGRVSSPAGDSFMIDDGSGTPVMVIMPAGTYTPEEGMYGCVTGISSCENVDGNIVRMLRSVGRVALPQTDNGIVDDTFTGRTILAYTEDLGHYPWIGAAGTTVGAGLLSCNGGMNIASLGDYKPADFKLETSFKINNADITNVQALIVMRQGAPNTPVASGYFLAILPKWSDLGNEAGWLLMWHDGVNAHTVTSGQLNAVNWSNFHNLEITAVGNSWSAKFDGSSIFTNIADLDPIITTTGGYIGLGTIGANVDYDSVHITNL